MAPIECRTSLAIRVPPNLSSAGRMSEPLSLRRKDWSRYRKKLALQFVAQYHVHGHLPFVQRGQEGRGVAAIADVGKSDEPQAGAGRCPYLLPERRADLVPYGGPPRKPNSQATSLRSAGVIPTTGAVSSPAITQ